MEYAHKKYKHAPQRHGTRVVIVVVCPLPLPLASLLRVFIVKCFSLVVVGETDENVSP